MTNDERRIDPDATGVRRAGSLEGRADLPSRLGRRRRWVLGALGAGVVVLVPLTVLFAALWSSANREREDFDQVRGVAGLFADRFLTLDSANLEPTKRGVLALSTGAFRRTYEEGLETGFLQAMLEVGHTRTETTVEEIYVGNVDSRAAHVIVQAETVSNTTDADGTEQPPRVLTLWLELDLVEQDDGWLVDGVRNLNFGRAPAVTTTTGGSVTTTSAAAAG